MNELARRIEALTLNEVLCEDDEESEDDDNVDRPWRELE